MNQADFCVKPYFVHMGMHDTLCDENGQIFSHNTFKAKREKENNVNACVLF